MNKDADWLHAVFPSAKQPKPASAGFRLGMVLAILGATGFAAKGVVVKLAYEHGAVDSSTLAALRMLFALPPFVVLAIWTGARSPKLTWRDWRDVVILGFFGGYLTGGLDFAGLQFVSAGLERLIIYLTPTIVLILHALQHRRAVSIGQGMALVLSYAGALVVLGGEAWRPGANTAWGACLVFGSACTYAIYLVRSGQIVHRLGALRLTSLATSSATLMSVAHLLFVNPMAALAVPAPVLWLSLANGLLCTFAPMVMVMLAIERLGAPLASQCGMVGPVVTVALGAIFLGEGLTPGVVFGTFLVLGGICLLAMVQMRPPATPPPLPKTTQQALTTR